MKYLCYLILLLSYPLFSQTKIDDLVSIEIPGTVVEIDTMVSNVKMQVFQSNLGDEIYIVQKIVIDTLDNNVSDLPTDSTSLKSTYHNYINETPYSAFRTTPRHIELSQHLIIWNA